jgi:hypothetical protein
MMFFPISFAALSSSGRRRPLINKYECTFCGESLCGRESDPTAATGDNGGFPF